MMTRPGEDTGLAGLYIHVPFCARVCPYCDFAVTTGGREKQHRYVNRLLTEMDLYAEDSWCFDTVYLGGGTPSRLALEDIQRITEHLGSSLDITRDAGMSLEVNPEDVDVETLASWRSLGFDFISLGVQSLNPENLAFLGRSHSPPEAERAVELARQAGFPTVSLDLIYGLPTQSRTVWQADLEQALALQPNHLSCYQLTVHEATAFGRRRARGQLREADEDQRAELFDFTHRFLLDAGFEGYEVSNFAATPEHRSRHNRKYWNHTPYLGLGPAAHSFDGDSRWWNVRRIGNWENEIEEGRRPVAELEQLTNEALMLEAVMLGLRTRDGLDPHRIRQRYGFDLIRENEELIELWIEEGLLEERDRHLRPTIKGLAVAEGLAAAIRLS
jgi:oxygen-independent coproporphyrinogen-3 oxidase